MKTYIKLEKALDLINGSAAIIVTSEEYTPVVYPSIFEDEIVIKWPIDGEEYNICIDFEENKTVEITESALVLIDTDGFFVTLTLLFRSQIKSFCLTEDFQSI
jgi:hypothetical protein